MKEKFKRVVSSIKQILIRYINFIKLHKKQVLLSLGLFLIVFIPTFLYINLTNPTKINSLIASVVGRGAPANSYFEDEVFYKAVVDAYNEENNASLPYTTNLTDAQLKTITNFSYSENSNDKLTSVKGLEKLTNIESLFISYAEEVTEVNVSENRYLKRLILQDLNLKQLNIDNNVNLIELWAGGNKISSINLSNNTKLKELNIGNNELNNIDLSENTSLTELYLYNNNLSSIDLSKNTSLTKLQLHGNNLSSIDLDNNIKLRELIICDNHLKTLNVEKATDLVSLDSGENDLFEINLNNNLLLEELRLEENNLKNIDLIRNINLKLIKIDSNFMSEIKLPSGYSKIKDIGIQNTNQIKIQCGNNIIQPAVDYKFYINKKLIITEILSPQTVIDNLNLIGFTAKIYTEGIENKTSRVEYNDILKIYDEETEILSIPIFIIRNSNFEDEVFYRAVVNAYNKENKASLPYTSNLTDEQLKTITKFSYSGISGNKITNLKGIEKLTNLQFLELEYNNLNSISLSDNKELIWLWLVSNGMENININENQKLKYLLVGKESITSINLNNNPQILSLVLGDKYLESVDLSNNLELEYLYLDGDLDHFPSMEGGTISGGFGCPSNIKSLNLKNNVRLKGISVANNSLKSIDIENNVLLYFLDLSNNKLNSINLSNNTKLTQLHLYGNPLIFEKQRLLKGKSVSSNYISNIKLPEGSNKYFITYEMENDAIAIFSDNKITGLKSGNTNLVATLNGVKESGSSFSSDMRINGNILVYDLTSSKYNINHDEKYIYVGADSINSSLNNIKLENISGKIENNKLVLYDSDIKVDEYRLVGISSSTYDLSNEYIYTETNIFDKSKITCINCTLEESGNTLNIKYGSTTLKSYKIVGYSSSVYDLSKDYIYIGINTFDKSKITCTNCTLEESGNTLNIKYGSTTLKSYKIVSYSSSTYDLSNEYIYTGTNTFDKSKITCINCTLEESNNTLNIKYGSATLKSYKIVSYSSSTYNLGKDYIYIGINTFDKSKITCTNCTLEESGNTLNIKYGSTTLKSYKLVSISSNKYDLSKDNIRLNKDEVFDINSVSVINGTKEYSNNKLYIKYNSDILKVYNITYRLKGDVNNDGKITNADVSKLFAYYKGKIKLTEDDLSVSDLNNDGKITNADVSKLFAYYKGKIKEL